MACLTSATTVGVHLPCMVGSGLGGEMRRDGLRLLCKYTMVVLVWSQLYGKPSLSSISYVLAIVFGQFLLVSA